MRITANKKERWIDRLGTLKLKVNDIYNEVNGCNISDDKIDFLANMTCCFDEAIAEIENLEELHQTKAGEP